MWHPQEDLLRNKEFPVVSGGGNCNMIAGGG